MAQVFTFIHVMLWNIVQVRMLHWGESGARVHVTSSVSVKLGREKKIGAKGNLSGFHVCWPCPPSSGSVTVNFCLPYLVIVK